LSDFYKIKRGEGVPGL